MADPLMRLINHRQSSKILPFFISICIGFLVFLTVIGPYALRPSNIAWLGHGDPATHYLGWEFFRHIGWSFPLGLNPSYGLEISNAILYSDSIPVLAFLFKPFSLLLTSPFQYFGLWLLLCFIFQAWFTYQLISLVTKNTIFCTLGACLFCLSPPMLWRMYEHLSLAGHFLILASLYLALVPLHRYQSRYWIILLIVSALTHAYLLAMVGLIWLADVLGRLINKSLSGKGALTECVIGVLAVFIACWQAGYFSVGAGVSSGGFGYLRLNLVSLINPMGWSFVLPDIPVAKGDYEGFNYLGLGIILLALVAIPSLLSFKTGMFHQIRKRPFLLLAMIGLLLFSVSNRLGIASFNYEYVLPTPLLDLANIFRASGRMFWPIYYLVLLAIIFLVVRGYSKRVATMMLGLALLIQVIDTSKGWSSMRAHYMDNPSATWNTGMTDSFWGKAGLQYKKVRWIMPGNRSENWQAIASYAATYGMATDAVYLARTNTIALSDAQKKARETLLSGEYEADSLYFLDESILPQAALNFDSQRDLFAKIDGFYVIAPGWKCRTCQAEKGEMNIAHFLPASLALGERLVFKKNRPGLEYLGSGWSLQEDWGTWSDGTQATIILPVNSALAKTIIVEARPLLYAAHHQQVIQASINGIATNAVTLTMNAPTQFTISIPLVVQEQLRSKTKLMTLKLQFPDAVRPSDIGMGEDTRKLAIGLISLVIQ
jgi:hypothetical protein